MTGLGFSLGGRVRNDGKQQHFCDAFRDPRPKPESTLTCPTPFPACIIISTSLNKGECAEKLGEARGFQSFGATIIPVPISKYLYQKSHNAICIVVEMWPGVFYYPSSCSPSERIALACVPHTRALKPFVPFDYNKPCLVSSPHLHICAALTSHALCSRRKI
jgi:hypothetical protein